MKRSILCNLDSPHVVVTFNPLVSHFYWIYIECTKQHTTHYISFLFLFFLKTPRTWQCVITADGENDLRLLEDNHSPLSQCFLQLLEKSAGQCRQKVFRARFKVLQAPWVMAVNSFKKCPRKEGRWRKVWWSWWPNATKPTAIINSYSCITGLKLMYWLESKRL